MQDTKRIIGYTHSDKIEWPATDIYGNPYTKPPVATAGIGGNRFVVLPYGFWNNPESVEMLESLRAQYAPPPKSKRQLADETNEAGE